jgi:branched-chain amino acid transport system substrate-binding protein
MKRDVVLFSSALLLVGLSCAGPEKRQAAVEPSAVAAVRRPPSGVPRTADWQDSTEVDAETREVLEKINSAGAYEVPGLELRQDSIYAKTAGDVEPFRHVKPFKEHFLLQMEYTGPGRAIPEPDDIEAVKIGFIGPIMSTVSVATGGKSHEEALGIKMLQGARLAIEQANARGGYLKRHIPFELVVSNDNGLWGASGNEIIKMAYKDKVWAILGTIDGANSHIAIRVALKAEIVIMNSGDADPTFIETNIPWVFRCIGDDRQQSYLLVDYMYRKLGLKRVGVIRASNRYGRFGVREVRDGSRRLGYPIILEMAYELGSEDFSLQLQRLKQANLEAIVHWGDALEGAGILNQMRAMGMDQPYFACDRCISDEFVATAGPNAEGVICTSAWNPARKSKKLDEFRRAFGQRFGEEPETFAAHAYDGINMLIWAIQVAGLNRAKIRDVLAHRAKPFDGVTGDIRLSACLDDVGDAYLAKCENGKWNYYCREDLKVPQGYLRPRESVSELHSTVGSK